MSDKLQRPIRLILVLVLIVLLIVVAIVLWRRDGPSDGVPRPSDSPMAVSPLPSPSATAVSESPPGVWSSRATALLWVVLGIFLSLGLALLIVRRYRQDE
jgi:hypothetical protein